MRKWISYLVAFWISVVCLQGYCATNNNLSSDFKADQVLSAMATRVDREALYATHPSQIALSPYKKDYYDLFASIAAMNAIQENVNTMSFGYYRELKKQYFQNTNLAILKQAGICGQQAEVFMRLLAKLNIKTRAIQFYNIDKQHNNHIAAEVYFNNKWNYFDVTWGTFFLKNPYHQQSSALELMSINDLLHIKKPLGHAEINASNLSYWYHPDQMKFYYLTSPRMNLVINGSGQIDLYHTTSNNNIINYSNKDVPNFFGIYQFQLYKTLEPHRARITYILNKLPPSKKFVMDVNYIACAYGSKIGLDIKSPHEKNKPLFITQLNVSDLKKGENIFSSRKLHLKAGDNLMMTTTTSNSQNFCYIGINKFSFNN